MKLKRVSGGEAEDLQLPTRTITTLRDAYFHVTDKEAGWLLSDGTGRWTTAKQSAAKAMRLANRAHLERRKEQRARDNAARKARLQRQALETRLAKEAEARRKLEQERLAPALEAARRCIDEVSKIVNVQRDAEGLLHWLQTDDDYYPYTED